MYAAESLENHEPGVLHEIVEASCQEEVRVQQLLAISQLLLSLIKIEVDGKVLQELGDRIFVRVRLLRKIIRQRLASVA